MVSRWDPAKSGTAVTQATSNDVSTERQAWALSLQIDKTVFATDTRVTLTATPDQKIYSQKARRRGNEGTLTTRTRR